MDERPTQYVAVTSNKIRKTALILMLPSLCGFWGLHRLYVGRISGLMMLLVGWTAISIGSNFFLGVVLVFTVHDLLQISLGQFCDNVGQPLRR